MIRVEGDGFVNILVRVAWADGPPVWIIMTCSTVLSGPQALLYCYNLGALISTYAVFAILGVPYHNYSLMARKPYPKY